MRRISERNTFPNFDLRKEYLKIEKLLSIDTPISYPYGYGVRSCSIQDAIAFSFLEWNLRGTFISIDEMRYELGINTDLILQELAEETVLHFLQYAINCVKRACDFVKKNHPCEFQSGYATGIAKNISELASKLGTDIVLDEHNDEYFLQYKNDTVAAVAKENPDISASLYEYQHINNRNNLKRKMEILSTLFKHLESLEGKLKGTEFKSLISDTKGMINAPSILTKI